MSDAVFDRPIPSEDYIQVWCAPCDQFLSFLLDGTALVNHAQRHSVIVSRDENGGIYIGRPAIPAPILPNADAMLDWHDTWMTAPDDVWGAAWRLAINGQDTRTTIRIPRS